MIPLLEVSIGDSAWEALSANPDALQHTVTPQLMDDQEVLHQACRDEILCEHRMMMILLLLLLIIIMYLPGHLDSLGIRQRTK